MSDKETGYWVVANDALLAEIERLLHEEVEAKKRRRTVCVELGGTGSFMYCSSGQATGYIEFDADPGVPWKASKNYPGYYRPLKNRKAGKLIAEKLASAPLAPARERIATLTLGRDHVFVGHAIWQPGYQKLGDAFILTASVRPGMDPEGYWQPQPGVRRMKNSEYWTLKEADNERKESTSK